MNKTMIEMLQNEFYKVSKSIYQWTGQQKMLTPL